MIVVVLLKTIYIAPLQITLPCFWNFDRFFNDFIVLNHFSIYLNSLLSALVLIQVAYLNYSLWSATYMEQYKLVCKIFPWVIRTQELESQININPRCSKPPGTKKQFEDVETFLIDRSRRIISTTWILNIH